VSVGDSNGVGVADTVVVMPCKGKKTVPMILSG
jgi:hypothetical protein